MWFLTTLLVHDSMYLSLRPGPGFVMSSCVRYDMIHCVPGQVLLLCAFLCIVHRVPHRRAGLCYMVWWYDDMGWWPGWHMICLFTASRTRGPGSVTAPSLEGRVLIYAYMIHDFDIWWFCLPRPLSQGRVLLYAYVTYDSEYSVCSAFCPIHDIICMFCNSSDTWHHLYVL